MCSRLCISFEIRSFLLNCFLYESKSNFYLYQTCHSYHLLMNIDRHNFSNSSPTCTFKASRRLALQKNCFLTWIICTIYTEYSVWIRISDSISDLHIHSYSALPTKTPPIQYQRPPEAARQDASHSSISFATWASDLCAKKTRPMAMSSAGS